MEKIAITDLREHLEHYSAQFQNSLSASSISPEVQHSLDELAKYQHYMFSEIIDFLSQME